MANSMSASCSPEKVSLASNCSNSLSLGNVHDATGSSSPLLAASGGIESPFTSSTRATEGFTRSPSLHEVKELAVRVGAKKPNPSCFNLDLDGDSMALNFHPRESLHKWRKLSSCEEFVGTKRSKHTIVAWNDRIYVFGGDNGRRMLNDFLVSHIHDSSWARVVYTGKWSMYRVLYPTP